MTQKYFVTFAIILYAIVVPFLEINGTHVFNPDWTPHSRIHEVWQLITNSGLGLVCLWLVWRKEQLILGAILSFLVEGGFLVAFVLKNSYGGSMKYLDGSEKTIAGINLGVFGFGIATLLLIAAIFLERRRLQTAS